MMWVILVTIALVIFSTAIFAHRWMGRSERMHAMVNQLEEELDPAYFFEELKQQAKLMQSDLTFPSYDEDGNFCYKTYHRIPMMLTWIEQIGPTVRIRSRTSPELPLIS